MIEGGAVAAEVYSGTPQGAANHEHALKLAPRRSAGKEFIVIPISTEYTRAEHRVGSRHPAPVKSGPNQVKQPHAIKLAESTRSPIAAPRTRSCPFKYVVSHPAVTVAIPGTTQVTRLTDNQGAGQCSLPDAEMRRRIETF